MAREEDASRSQLFRMNTEQREKYVWGVDQFRGAERSQCAINLVKTASFEELNTLEAIRQNLVELPVRGSFLFRLDQAINIKRDILNFKSNNFSGLLYFLERSPDVLRGYLELILDLEEAGSNNLAFQASCLLSQEAFLDFNNTLETMLSCQKSIEGTPYLVLAFNLISNEMLIKLESEQEEVMTAGRSRDAMFGGDIDQITQRPAANIGPKEDLSLKI